MKRRKSLQRERIFKLIEESRMHPTAQWLLIEMKKDFPMINEANLYRNIRILIEEGEIVTRDIGDGVEHYDSITTNHYHFVCKECGRILDLDIPVEEHVSSEMQQLIEHQIESHTIQFFGICEDCQENHKKTE